MALFQEPNAGLKRAKRAKGANVLVTFLTYMTLVTFYAVVSESGSALVGSLGRSGRESGLD